MVSSDKDLAVNFAGCPQRVKDMIETKHAGAIPYRRRGFEAEAMIRELMLRTAKTPHSLEWGAHLPPSPALGKAHLSEPRTIAVIGNTDNSAAAEIMASLTKSVSAVGGVSSAITVAPLID